MVHLQLIDTLYESQGMTIFNEILTNQENPEFRFFNEEVLESNSSPDILVLNGQSWNAAKKKKETNATSIVELRKIFMINQSFKDPSLFQNTQRYFIKIDPYEIHLKEFLSE